MTETELALNAPAFLAVLNNQDHKEELKKALLGGKAKLRKNSAAALGKKPILGNKLLPSPNARRPEGNTMAPSADDRMA